jgi:vacuolar protein sorting-associated protein IST1
VHHTQNYDEGTQGKILEPAKFDSSQERKTEESVDYADVIAAARAAAESADRAVAAARAAAEFARNRTQQIAASTAGNLEDSSGTDLDSDSNDGQDRAPVSTEIS